MGYCAKNLDVMATWLLKSNKLRTYLFWGHKPVVSPFACKATSFSTSPPTTEKKYIYFFTCVKASL